MRGLALALTYTLAFTAAFTLAVLSVDDVLAQPIVLQPMPHSDPLFAELSRCLSIRLAAEGDRICQQTWAENRQRFFQPEAR